MFKSRLLAQVGSICENWQKLGPNWSCWAVFRDCWWNSRKKTFFDIFVLLGQNSTKKHRLVVFWKFFILQPTTLAQGGLEIPCNVTTKSPATIKNHIIMDRYKNLIEELYWEPKDEAIIVTFLFRIPEP